MSKKHKIPKKMIIKYPETSNMDDQYKIPENFKYTINNIKSVILNSRYIQLLILITCIGFFLRFYNLGFNSLWLDEASTLNFATLNGDGGSFADIWTYTLQFDPNPPTFVWLEYIIINLFGISESTLRLMPALFGALTVPVMYFVGKEFIDENGGIIAATAFALSPFLILYSQEARSYSMLLFFITLSMYMYLKAIKSEGLKYWLLFVLTTSCAVWVHFYAVIFLGSLMIYALVEYKLKYIKELTLSGVIITIASIPVLFITLNTILEHASKGSRFGVQGFGLVYETLIQVSGYNMLSLYLIVLLFICGIVILYLKERAKSILLLWILFFTFSVSWYLSYSMSMVPRYLIFVSIALFLGIAASYKFFYLLTKNKVVIYSLIIFLVAINTPFLMNYYTQYSKDDWRGFSTTFSRMTQPGDLVIVVPGYIDQPLNYYYSNKTDGTIEYRASNESELIYTKSLQTKNSYYIVTGDIQAADPSGKSLQWLKENTQQISQSGNILLLKS